MATGDIVLELQHVPLNGASAWPGGQQAIFNTSVAGVVINPLSTSITSSVTLPLENDIRFNLTYNIPNTIELQEFVFDPAAKYTITITQE